MKPSPLPIAPLEPSSPYLDPPRGGEVARWIGAHFCLWDDDPPAAWGQVWIPVCPWCRRGPLQDDQRTCGDCEHPAPNRGSWHITRWAEGRHIDRVTARLADWESS